MVSLWAVNRPHFWINILVWQTHRAFAWSFNRNNKYGFSSRERDVSVCRFKQRRVPQHYILWVYAHDFTYFGCMSNVSCAIRGVRDCVRTNVCGVRIGLRETHVWRERASERLSDLTNMDCAHECVYIRLYMWSGTIGVYMCTRQGSFSTIKFTPNGWKQGSFSFEAFYCRENEETF